MGLITPLTVSAQSGSVQGRLRDDRGATVEGAAVVVRARAAGTILGSTASDALGFFRLDGLPLGPAVLEVRRLGFATLRSEWVVQDGQSEVLSLELRVEALELEGLTVGASRVLAEVAFDEEAGQTVRSIDAQQLRNLPGFIEPDPLRAADALPGVVTTSDFSAAFNVRGGSADQNLILIDGLPVFNPAHLGGLVSVFNPDMIGRAVLRSGGFPAEYGGRVSSVLEIETDPGEGSFGIDGALSLLTARASVQGGLSDGTKNSLGLRDAKWRVAGRRSYFDVLFAPFFDVPYRLADVQAVFEGWTSRGDRVSFTGYSGGDVLDLTTLDSEDFPLRITWDWGNDLVGGRWTRLRPGGDVLDVRLGYSRFTTGLAFPDFGDTDVQSRVSQSTLAVDWERRPSAGLITKVGFEGRRLGYHNRFESGGTEFGGGTGSGWGTAGYAQLQWRPNNAWLVETGVRLDAWYPEAWEHSVEVAPRVSVKRFLGDGTVAVKASVGRFTQFLHSIRDEELPIGLDLWVLTGPQAPHVVSDQIQGGVEISPGDGWFFSAEGYARDFDGVVTTNFSDDPNDDFDDYLAGRGHAYGVDMLAQRSTGATTGWVSVSWLHTRRTFPDFGSGLDPAPEVEYPPIFDRRWDVDLVLSHTFGGYETGLRWSLGTGLPYTQPLGVFPFLSPRVTSGTLEWDVAPQDGEGDGPSPGGRELGVLLGPRNAARFPVRHRLDVSVRRQFEKSWGTITPYVNILNLYNQSNALFYFFEYDKNPPQRSGYSMFPLLPTFGAEVRFR